MYIYNLTLKMIIHRSLKCLIRIYNALILTFYFIKPGFKKYIGINYK